MTSSSGQTDAWPVGNSATAAIRPEASGTHIAPAGDPEAQFSEPAPDPRPKLHALVLGLVLVGAAGIGLHDLRTDEWLALGTRGSDPGPGFLPELWMWLLLAGGLVQICTVTLAALQAGGIGGSDEFFPQRLWMPALLCLSLGAYYGAIRSFGYLGPSITFALIWVPLIHFRSGQEFRRRHLLQFPFEALVIACVLYALFRYGIRVPLP